ncbi:gustatory receptor for sugar taste 43a-like [Tribolium madens]|uniref:gustatory receptor for sugar taste 43a-like n=1 Tax=Tribolium madens TaxID=41895 RepID=UPI001CF762E9|nr:gustatory receptor for sugar taste 43a-like [Tribolium madens]
MTPHALISSDFHSILKPFLHLAKMAGFLPVAWVPKGQKYSLKRSINSWICSYVLGGILFALSMVGLTEDLNSAPIRMKNPVVKYIIMIDLGEIVVTVLAGILTSPLKLSYFWKMLAGFGRIEQVLPSYYPPEEKNRCLWGVVIFLVLASSVIFFDFVVWGLSVSDLGVFFKRFLTVYVSYFLIFVQQIPFCFFVRLIRLKIEDLNGAFRAGLERAQNMENQWISVMKKVKQQKVVLTYERLNDFMRLVEEIEEVIEAINGFYGVHTLFILFSCLLHLVVTPYYLLIEVINDGYLPFILLQIAWIILHLIRLMVIVEICQRCIDEYQVTTNLVLKLLTSPILPDIKEQVEILAVQVSNKKIKFSSFGMLKISRSLLTSFGGALTTFLVILFQYGGIHGNIY